MEPVFSVSDFLAVFNQTLEFAYPSVTIIGELSEFRVSKNKWLFFNLQDADARLNFFGTVYNLPGPLEDGMMLKVRGRPQLSPKWGFSINVTSISVSGEGSINKALKLLDAKLTKEGIFDPARKRTIPYPPQSIGLITSRQSAAFADFCKVLNNRWGGVHISLYDVLVQGEQAPVQITSAINYFSTSKDSPEVLVITRGGGSAEDLSAFNNESVVRAVAASRIPTVVAVGHETDVSLSEKAADLRAATPSNAAELLVPDKIAVKEQLTDKQAHLVSLISYLVNLRKKQADNLISQIEVAIKNRLVQEKQFIVERNKLINALSPLGILKKGYAIVRAMPQRTLLKGTKGVKKGANIELEMQDGMIHASVTGVI